MEQREEKTENIQRKRSRGKSSSSSLPLDLTSEIFSRLPAKSVVRFRCVSKLWSSITTAPYFTNSFETRPNLMFFFKEGDKFFVFTIPQHNQNPNESYSYSSSEIIDSYHTTYPKRCCVTTLTESVHGLICFRKAATPIIWNPTMRKFKPLRKLDERWKNIKVSLGYDPVDGKHKVVCMPYGNAFYECRVLTLGSDQEWRTVKTNHKNSPFTFHGGVCYRQSRCINGVIYYRADTNSGRVILSFDVRSERFDVIELPWDENFGLVMMMSYKGRLACLGFNHEKNSRSLWVLEDVEKREWSCHTYLPISHYEPGLENYFNLTGITNDGELIYVPNTVLERFHVIYFDAIRETFRRVIYKGVADKGFRLRNGLEDKPIRRLHFFPNHIETLMSL
ncbi:putative F-box protein [Arabidopsis thaliana]